MSRKLSLDNDRVFLFYKKHTNISFETANVFLVDFMEKLFDNAQPTDLSQLNEGLFALQQQMKQMNESLIKSPQDINTLITTRLHEMRKEYIEEIKIILSGNVTEHILPLLHTYTSSIYDKTTSMLNDIIPRNQEHITRHVSDSILQLKENLLQDAQKISHSNPESFREYLMNLDQKISQVITSTSVSLSKIESKIEYDIKDMKNFTENQFTSVKEISSQNQTEINSLLFKMSNSSHKGKLSENIMCQVLNDLYPSGQIDSVGTIKETGDIMLYRKDKPIILIENKNFDSKNVPYQDVEKFMRDTKTQNCCGLFLSQHTGVSNKTNFEINIENNNVLLYLHNVNYDADKIKVAIDIIDHFKCELDNNKNPNGIIMDKSILDDINSEYQQYIIQRTSIHKTLRDFNSSIIKQLDSIDFPSLKKYLTNYYAFSSTIHKCEICNDFQGKNEASLSAHQRKCKLKHSTE